MQTVSQTNEETILGFISCLSKVSCFNSAGQGGRWLSYDFSLNRRFGREQQGCSIAPQEAVKLEYHPRHQGCRLNRAAP